MTESFSVSTSYCLEIVSFCRAKRIGFDSRDCPFHGIDKKKRGVQFDSQSIVPKHMVGVEEDTALSEKYRIDDVVKLSRLKVPLRDFGVPRRPKRIELIVRIEILSIVSLSIKCLAKDFKARFGF
jgi:hypothetical protein